MGDFLYTIYFPLLIGGLTYLLMGVYTRSIVLDDIANAAHDEKNYPDVVQSFMVKNMDTLLSISVMLWPLFYFYRIGTNCGRKLYFKIVNNYEDRIAAWYV